MILRRQRARFRYEGDPDEVTVELSAVEARDIAEALRSSRQARIGPSATRACQLGEQLTEFLEDTEEGPGGRLHTY